MANPYTPIISPPLTPSVLPYSAYVVPNSQLLQQSVPATPGITIPLIPTPTPTKKRTSFTACAACQAKHCACDEHRYVSIINDRGNRSK